MAVLQEALMATGKAKYVSESGLALTVARRCWENAHARGERYYLTVLRNGQKIDFHAFDTLAATEAAIAPRAVFSPDWQAIRK